MRLVRTAAFSLLLAAPLLAQTPTPAPPPAAPVTNVWTVDKAHSMASFKIRHLMANVTGQFRDFDVNIRLDRANPAASSVDFTIQAASIDTGSPSRDEHLRSPDFFEVTKYPTIAFKSTDVKPKSATQFDVTGDLTMHGVTKRLTVSVTFLGFGKDARGVEKAGFDVEAVLDRKDYGISWNRILDEGGVLLGDEVKVSISLEVGKAPAPPAAAK
jgi:polyisoprenoid-binding protein YceI